MPLMERFCYRFYDISHNLLASVPNGPPPGTNGNTTFSVSTPGIAFFSITNPGADDNFGVR